MAPLVISGFKAQYRGTGTIKGRSELFKFVLTAYDGNITSGGGVDKFRMKIMRASDDTVVCDNNIGASDDIDAEPMEIKGGSIVIHKATK